ncbi:MAG: RNA methyltransferase [Anaerolineae bacterium]|nr:RNA methyltransferase [Gloeobacterales cyanobacterium ES-bin-313]
MDLHHIRIVLVEPAGALNLGSIARSMKNFGLSQLWLVAPRCSVDDPDAQRMAVHAQDILTSAVVCSDLAVALADCERVAGTTARERKVSTPFQGADAVAPWLLGTTAEVAYIFGPEDRGLNNAELSVCQRHVQIPTNPAYSSLNLAQAVTLCAYELFTCQPTPTTAKAASQPANAELEGFYTHLEQTLLTIGYLQPHTASSKLQKFRRLFNRAELTTEEITLLRGVLRQLAWATSQKT